MGGGGAGPCGRGWGRRGQALVRSLLCRQGGFGMSHRTELQRSLTGGGSPARHAAQRWERRPCPPCRRAPPSQPHQRAPPLVAAAQPLLGSRQALPRQRRVARPLLHRGGQPDALVVLPQAVHAHLAVVVAHRVPAGRGGGEPGGPIKSGRRGAAAVAAGHASHFMSRAWCVPCLHSWAAGQPGRCVPGYWAHSERDGVAAHDT